MHIMEEARSTNTWKLTAGATVDTGPNGPLERPSVPGPGRTLASAAELRGVRIRLAVSALREAFDGTLDQSGFDETFGPRWGPSPTRRDQEPHSLRAAWALTNTWLLARMAGVVDSNRGFAEAERWFLGSYDESCPSLAAQVDPSTERRALHSLSQLAFDESLEDLLPYVLERHGPGSRLSTIKDPSTRVAREAKRRTGVFYTPADVAEFMAGTVLAKFGRSPWEARCLDPSCGTGVYLLALMRSAQRASREIGSRPLEFASRCLFGFDLNELVVESAAFVLLHECIHEVERLGVAPLAAWHTLRLNLAAVDALQVASARTQEDGRTSEWLSVRRTMRTALADPANGTLPEPAHAAPQSTAPSEWLGALGQTVLTPLDHIFPEAMDGFDVLVGNPPYARLGAKRDDLRTLAQTFACLRGREPTGNEDAYPLFVEMMWRLTAAGENAAALVTPLSIAFHQGRQFTACRGAMSTQGGRWSFAFFDREPHGLFEEDVKTRNAILFRREGPGTPKRGTPAEIETTPLLKWTSRTRERLFASISETPMDRVPIDQGIPKLDGASGANAFFTLSRIPSRLENFARDIQPCQPREATRQQDRPCVFVASTAYNFLNVYRTLTVDPTVKYPLAQNKVYRFVFRNKGDAAMGLAVLDSRLTYWLWLVLGDGFHVSLSFLRRIPVDFRSFSEAHRNGLRDLGEQLWGELQKHRLVSINKGKQTIAYRPLACGAERDAIDAILLEEAGIPKAFGEELRTIVRARVVVDENDHRRRDLARRVLLPGGSS